MTQSVTVPRETQITNFFDESDPRSFMNRIPESLNRALKAIPTEYLELSEADWNLKFKNKSGNQYLTDEDQMVRANFWHEYNKSLMHKTSIHLSGIYGGAMTYQSFERRFLHQPDRLAFMVCPVASQASLARYGLDLGMKKIIQGLKAEVVREDGTLDAKAYSSVLQAVIWLDAWQNGGITQKIEQKTLNVNTTPQELAESGSGFLDKKSRIEALEQKLKLSKEVVVNVVPDTSDKPSGD